MGFLDTVFAGIGGGAHGLGAALSAQAQQDEERKYRLATQALQVAKFKQETTHQDAQDKRQLALDAADGLMTGPTPNGAALSGAMDLAGGAVGAGLPGVNTGSLAVQAMRVADPGRYDANRYRDLGKGSYQDTYNTKAAQAMRIGLDQKRAEIPIDVAKADALLPGEVKKAGAVAAVTEPIHTQGAVNTALRVTPIHTAGAIQVSNNTSANALRNELRTIPLHAKASADAWEQKPNDSETGSAAWAGDLAQSKAVLDRIGKPEYMAQILQKHKSWGNFITSKEGQQFNQAADQFVNAAQLATEGVRFSPAKEKAMRLALIPNGTMDQSVVDQMQAGRDMLGRTAGIKAGRAKGRVHPDVRKALGWDDGKSGLEPHTQTIDEMIKAGKSDAEIAAALRGKQ